MQGNRANCFKNVFYGMRFIESLAFRVPLYPAVKDIFDEANILLTEIKTRADLERP